MQKVYDDTNSSNFPLNIIMPASNEWILLIWWNYEKDLFSMRSKVNGRSVCWDYVMKMYCIQSSCWQLFRFFLFSCRRVLAVEIFCISKVNSIILNNVDWMLQSIRPKKERKKESVSNFISIEFLWIYTSIN